jgi:hypothetical protein
MASFEISGRLAVKNDTVVVSDKFTKREFVIETEEKYPQLVALQLSQDKCSMIDNARKDDILNCSVNVRGRKWTDPKTGVDKYFNTLEAWAVSLGQTSHVAPTQNAEVSTTGIPTDDLPF